MATAHRLSLPLGVLLLCLQESKEMIKYLNSQLERERQEHSSAIELIAQQWQEEMKKAVEDYGRIKVGERGC